MLKESIRGDTIAAVSTAAGSSPRGIVRMSGPRAVAILRALLDAPVTKIPRAGYRSFDALLNLSGMRLPARIYLMRGPASYTREDIVEVHTFGAPAILQTVLDAMVRHSARLAGPGEFTRRAFLNGRIDLAQAEAVEALIRARSDSEHRAALDVLGGTLSQRVEALRNALADVAATVEVALDFSDQDVEIIDAAEVARRLRPIHDALAALCDARGGRLARHAVRAVLFGPPNAGKSSLFNALLRRERAIVSPHPGTTRDTLEAVIHAGEVEIVLVDTAGLRASEDDIETLAVHRSHESIGRADISLCVLDAAHASAPEAQAALASLAPGRAMVILNKCDLICNAAAPLAPFPAGVPVLSLSARTGAGLPELLAALRARVEEGNVARNAGGLMVSARQSELLRRAREALGRLINDAMPGTMDLIASDVREALLAVTDVTGGSVTEDVLDRIFSNFCIGK